MRNQAAESPLNKIKKMVSAALVGLTVAQPAASQWLETGPQDSRKARLAAAQTAA